MTEQGLTPSDVAFEPEFAKHHGCAWFVFGGDRIRDPNSAPGWASIAGQPAFQFKSWKELPSHIVWWSNLSKSETWALGQWLHFKDNGLFGFDWHGWISEQIVVSHDTLPGLVAGISETFARTGYALSQWCQARDAKPWSWGSGSLADVLAEQMQWSPSHEPNPQPVLAAAYHERIEQRIPPQDLNGKRKLVVSLPMHNHAKQMWLTRIPLFGQWRLLDAGLFPGGSDHAARWLADQPQPLLVKIGEPFWRSGEETRGMFWLGGRGRRFMGSDFEPVWLTGEEALDFARFAEFQLLSVYVGSDWQEQLPPDPFGLSQQDDPLAPFANSWQLRAAGAWRALASPTRDPHHRNKSFISERCLWMRALDRRTCFERAFRLEEAGFRVMAHGDGQATLLLDPSGNPMDWAAAIRKAGWCLPMGLAKILPMSAADALDDFVVCDHWIKRVGGTDSRWDIDRLVAPWSSVSGSVQSVMQKSAKSLLTLDMNEVPHWQIPWTEQLKAQARISVNRLKKQKFTG